MTRAERAAAAVALLTALWAVSAAGAQGLSPAGPPDQVLDEVLVLGEQPGPAMWKVSRDGHTMWIMGTLSPLPAKMTWRSQPVEAVIARSGEVLGNTSARGRADIGLFGALRLIPSLLRARDNPDGATLQAAMPADIYTRFSAMHQRFFGEAPNPKEKRRPLFAADELYRQALKKSGLTENSPVWPTVEKLAKRHKVRIRERQIDFKVEDPKGLIADLALIERDKEVACLVGTMDYIDRELPNIKRRARAWAIGDMPTLRSLPAAVDRDDCLDALLDALRPRLDEQIKQVKSQIEADRTGILSWMVLTYDTSFTALPVEDLLRSDGLVAGWRAAGYTVEEPQ
jgi:hypothetical protein